MSSICIDYTSHGDQLIPFSVSLGHKLPESEFESICFILELFNWVIFYCRVRYTKPSDWEREYNKREKGVWGKFWAIVSA